MTKLKYPIYIPSKGRNDKCLTANFLIQDNLDFFIVVEPQDFEAYNKVYDFSHLLVLPENNKGIVFARNWIKSHAIKNDAEAHWQIDDNIKNISQNIKGKSVPINSYIAFNAVETFFDKYSNIAIAGLSHEAFGKLKKTPISINKQVYCCILFNNKVQLDWRGTYAEDTDMSLRVLLSNWCTVIFNIYLIRKVSTMKMTGGNTSTIYQNDGKLKMAKELSRNYPRLVTIKRKYGIPRMQLKQIWHKFDTQLIPKKI